MKSFNHLSGTTSTEFQLGAGTGNEVRQVVLTSVGPGTAADREGNEILTSGVEFYDIKMLATSVSGTVAKQLRGTISGTTVTRIEDVFQEDFIADVELASDGTTFSITCVGTANFTVYATLTRVAE